MSPEEKKADPVQIAKLLGMAIGAAITIFAAVFAAGAVSAEARTLPHRMSAVELRQDRMEIRMDSLLRVSAQSWCLQRAQAAGEDWSDCVQ